MPFTNIVSFTNMSLLEIELSNTENPNGKCNNFIVPPGITVWRDVETGMHGEESKCCNIWIPWCHVADWFPSHHLTLKRGKTTVCDIWQARHPDGDFVRYSTGGYANPGLQIPGSAEVTGDRYCGLTVNKDDSVTLWEYDPTVHIPDFPEHLRHEHMQWHRIDHEKSHTGGEFLRFHRAFLAMFHDWYDAQPFADQSLVAGWSLLPPEFNQPQDAEAKYRVADVRKIETDAETGFGTWTTDNAFGSNIKGTLHRWLHHIPAAWPHRLMVAAVDRWPVVGRFRIAGYPQFCPSRTAFHSNGDDAEHFGPKVA